MPSGVYRTRNVAAEGIGGLAANINDHQALLASSYVRIGAGHINIMRVSNRHRR